MSNAKEYVKTLTISDLFNDENKCKYIIPIYQRNYAWGDDEISSLLQDIKNSCEQNKEQYKNYYIGSLVVYRRENSDFEVIDGQQRLTTLTLIMHHLGKLGFKNVFFEHRDESEQALSNPNSEKLPSNFSQALKTIKKVIDEWGDNKDEIVKFLLDKVEIIRTEVPEGTDLNHYFEIMNTRGEQLEKHEVLKARLMDMLPENEQSLFAKIWDACSDMSRYAVMGFDPTIREVIFSDKWSEKPKCFIKIIQDIEEYNKEIEKKNKEENKKLSIINMQGNVDGIKILDLINGSKNSGVNKNDFVDKYDGSFTPVIDFPNFLMHVLRIYLEMTDKCGDFTKTVPLDEKYLLNSFEEKIKDDESVRNFIYVLLICRYLFDCYVIKSNAIRTGEENWSLWAVRPNGSSYYYKNTFGNNTDESKNDEELDNSDDTKTVVMLLSMFHVSNPSRIYKNWLYAVLRWLFNNKDNITHGNYVDFLKDLCDKFYFGNNCQGKDITEIILGEEKINFYSNNKKWNDGVLVPNFVFNRLDYQLWTKYKKTYPQFRFTFRSSVEHHYPQHPSEEHGLERLEKETLDNFGNLYLLSQSKNSRLSKLTPEAKSTYYQDKNYDSLKQALMMEKTKELNNWKNEEILKHGEEMLEILNQPLSKTDS